MQPALHGKMFGGPGKTQGQAGENEQVRKRLFEKDFIILSEFSEQVGPVPLQFIPDEKYKGTFDASHFSVRIMTSDYQTPSGKLVGEDTQVLLSEKQDYVNAYVHYFSLNDINARGYVRQYCFSYITSSFSKLVDNFDSLKQQFSEVTAMLKCNNHRIFRRDLEHHLADLNHTMAELTEEGWDKMDDIDNSQLYLGFDFQVEDVPERDPSQVRSATMETSDILETLKTEMARPENDLTWLEVRRLRDLRRKQVLFQMQREKERPPSYITTSPVYKKGASHKLGSPDSGGSIPTPVHFTESFSSELTNSTTSSDVSQYQPQRVMTHTVQRFERRLRPLEELAPKAYSIVMDKLKDIHKFFSRSEITLEMEKEESVLLDPRSSLLTIGRVPMANFLQNFHHFLSNQPCPLLQPKPYQVSCKNTWGQPSEFADGEVVVDGEATEGSSGFDTSFLEERSGLNRCPLYIDLSHQSYPFQDSLLTSDQDYDYDTSLNQSDASKRTSTLISAGEPSGLEAKQAIGLRVEQEEDRISRGSHGSAAFVTPETGLSPANSNDDDEVNGWREDGGDVDTRDTHVSSFEVSSNSNDNGTETPVPNGQNITDQQTTLDNNHGNCFPNSPVSESNLDSGTRVPSSNEVSTMDSTNQQNPIGLSRKKSSLSLQGDLLGGKTIPTVTTSIVVAQPDMSAPDRRSGSLSPLTSSMGINSDGLQSTEVVSFATESWELWGSPSNGRANAQSNSMSNGKLKKTVPDLISDHQPRGEVIEEAHSAGSGQFDSPYLSASNIRHVHNSELKMVVDRTPRQDRSTPSDVSTQSISSEERHTPPYLSKRNGYPQSGGMKRPPGLPRELSLESKEHASPERFYSPMSGPPDGMFGSVSTTFTPYGSYIQGNSFPHARRSLSSQMSLVTEKSFYRGPSLVEIRGKGKLPLVSSIDLVESEYKFKPGRGIFHFCKDNMSIKDLFYCLLHGRPLAIIGSHQDENSIRRLVRLLWMFVPGHSCKQQVITWQDKPLEVKDLSRVKLIGLSNMATNNLGPNIKRYVSYWDVSTGKVCTPPYNGELLKPIVSRTRDRKNEQAFLAHTLSVLVDISMKAYVYYHSYCASSSKVQRQPTGEPAAKVFLSVHSAHPRDKSRRYLQNNFGIKGSDVDIIEHLVDIIRDQQLAEWRDNAVPSGTPHDADPVSFKVYNKHCRESTHKAKRPY